MAQNEKLVCLGKDPKKLGPFSLSGQTERARPSPCPLFLSDASRRVSVLRFSEASASDRNRRGIFHIRLAQKLRRLFRRSGVDVETRAPFKSCRLSELGHELDVPVVVV